MNPSTSPKTQSQNLDVLITQFFFQTAPGNLKTNPNCEIQTVKSKLKKYSEEKKNLFESKNKNKKSVDKNQTATKNTNQQ